MRTKATGTLTNQNEQPSEETAIKLVAPFVERHEGFKPKAYWDVNGWSIGHGHKMIRDAVSGQMRKVRKGDTINRSESLSILMRRLRQNAAQIRRDLKWSRTLSPGALAALYDIAYNAGPATLSASRSPSLNKNMNAPGADREAIVWKEVPTYRRSAGKVVKGLQNRRMDAVRAFKNRIDTALTGMIAAR